MSNKKSVVLNYNGQRIVLDTIAGYCGIYRADRNTTTKQGIRFELRTGKTIEELGNDKVSRDKVLGFLDNHFKPKYFIANLCQACIHKEDSKTDDCYTKHNNCNNYHRFKSFEREK